MGNSETQAKATADITDKLFQSYEIENDGSNAGSHIRITCTNKSTKSSITRTTVAELLTDCSVVLTLFFLLAL
jgi:hypothetical protein